MEEEESLNWGNLLLFFQKYISENLHVPDSNYIYITICIIIILITFFILRFFTSKNIKIEIYDKKEKSDRYNINLNGGQNLEHLIEEVKSLRNEVRQVIKSRKEIKKFSKPRVIYPEDPP